jgi:tetratricopeptide (TPR) repeat protein
MARCHACAMKTPFLFSLFAILSTISTLAQETPRPEIARAAELNENGDYVAAKNLLEPLLRPSARALTRKQTGDAWNILGTSYTLLGEYAKARRSFQAAIQIFKDEPDQIRYYASALDNLGSVEMEEGQFDSSKTLRLKAKSLYERNEDHMGLARVNNNLALVAIRAGRFKEASQWIEQAFQQAALSPESDVNSLAAMYSIKCTVEAHEKHWDQGLKWVQQEISVLPPESPLLADAYALRGEIYDRLGESRQAIADLQNALSRFAKSPGPATPLYLSTELIYAQILRHSGSRSEASRLETEANAALAQIRRQQCSGCAVSSLSFR